MQNLSKIDFGSADERRFHEGGKPIIGRHPDLGLPVRGTQNPRPRADDYDRMPVERDYRVGMFRMWDPAERAEYTAIMDRVVNGMFEVRARILIQVDDVPGEGPADGPGQHLKIWLEWQQVYVNADGVRDTVTPPPGSYL